MSVQLSFKLKDQYTMKIWNPAILGATEIKTISGEYFFAVLFSVHREKTSTEKTVAEQAKKILGKFSLEINSFEKDITSLVRISELKKSESFFTLTFAEQDIKPITFNPPENSGVCPENAAFLRSFIKFDEYVALLNELHSMALITEKEYYIERKTAQSKIRGIMEGYNGLIKHFHGDRKRNKVKLESVA